jgi:hypothetical protein
MPDTGLPPGGPCQAPPFLWSSPALKQATRAFRLAGDSMAIGARGSLARAVTRARERSPHSTRQAPRHCLETWSCPLPSGEWAESSAGDSRLATISRDSEAASCKIYGQQKKNVIHISSTAYEQEPLYRCRWRHRKGAWLQRANGAVTMGPRDHAQADEQVGENDDGAAVDARGAPALAPLDLVADERAGALRRPSRTRPRRGLGRNKPAYTSSAQEGAETIPAAGVVFSAVMAA